MRKILDELAKLVNATLTERASCFEMLLRRSDLFEFKITIPKEVLEWFVDGKHNNEPVWSDWEDYYPIHGESRDILSTEMLDDIYAFVKALADKPMRVMQVEIYGKSNKILEWNIGGNWQKISLGAILDGSNSL